MTDKPNEQCESCKWATYLGFYHPDGTNLYTCKKEDDPRNPLGTDKGANCPCYECQHGGGEHYRYIISITLDIEADSEKIADGLANDLLDEVINWDSTADASVSKLMRGSWD